ncbi:GSCFA domain-containing protein [Spirosoma linguale]|uniref:GSCFA domain protein n=1 Tax=Spirosoma linguale (strain ATCC 33905 / DSM 74 / LMG 10896 / Claus 1) TaxID=504472 RepID=D2QBX3_SPILD|nr:GSCFA domain protein [Spirosoma linguale DSM 74]
MKFKKWRPLPNGMNYDGGIFFTPEFDHRIIIDSDDGIFTIGSCFARNIEACLNPSFKVPSYILSDNIPEDIRIIENNPTRNRVLWHRYNVFSILHSIEWSLCPPTGFSRLMKVDNTGFVDPYAGCRDILQQKDAERLVNWADDTFKQIRECRVIIITLGLSEVWEDRETGLVMNCSPLMEMWRTYPERFTKRVVSCFETVEQLENIYALLKRYCPDDFKVIVTVSPIPLANSFRDVDVAVANTASKSILRAAAEEWTSRHQNVHYFPSYEIILNSRQEAVWTEDFRHPNVESIRHVMKVFFNHFIEKRTIQ